MPLRRRLLLLLSVTAAVFGLLTAALAAWPSWQGFAEVERGIAEEDGRRLALTLEREGERLRSSTTDWGHWDDTYAFVLGQDPDYEDANLAVATLQGLDVSDLVIVDRAGGVLWGGHLPEGAETLEAPDPALVAAVAPGGPLFGDAVDDARHAVVPTGHGLSLVAATPVSDSEATSDPVGMVLMAHELDAAFMQRVADQIQRTVRLAPHDAAAPATTVDRDRIHQRIAIEGVEGPVADAIISAPRSVAAVGRRSIVLLAVAVLVAMLGLGMVVVAVVDRSVVRRLRVMRDDASSIRREGRGRVRGADGDDELGELARSINDMVRSLEEAQERLASQNVELHELARMRQELVSVVSHELRTPLTAIQGFATTLRQHATRLDEDRRASFAQRIERNARRLDRLVSDLLILSRADQGPVSVLLEPVDVASLLDELAEDVELPIERDVPAGTTVLADAEHLRRMLDNLLTNARKYGAPPFGVSAERDGDRVRLRISDGGAGIAPYFVDQLFERFTQASTGDGRTARGIGLGLSIVRTLAEANGGHVHYDRDGAGTTFVLDLAAGPPLGPTPSGDRREELRPAEA